MPPKVERDELVADYQRVAAEMGERPTMDEYCERGEYSRTVIYGRFDSFADLKAAAGFDPGEHRIDADALLADLRRVAEEVGRSPPVEVYDELGEHNSKTLKQRFGNWKETLEAAGLEPTDHSEHFSHTRGVRTNHYQKRGGVETSCSNCGETVTVRERRLEARQNVFCDRECMAEFRSELTGEDSRGWEGGEEIVECEECGQTYQIPPAKKDISRFCSMDCLFEWQKRAFAGEGSGRWKGGYEPYYGPNWREQRRKARERDDYECQICGMDRDTHREKFDCEPHVHHIKRLGDFDDYQKANELPNLVTLCMRHHNMVDAGTIELPAKYTARSEAQNTS